tara:strand:+ start:221 stop:427 length:207 start_codon:yes stop_codon:yes gene_type:complete
MRIVNIINNELLIKKQKLENDLERCLNDVDKPTQEQVDEAIGLISKISCIDTSIASWEKYINFDKKEK